MSADAAQKSADEATRANNLQEQAMMDSQSARLVFVDHLLSWRDAGCDPQMAKFTVGFRNEGNARAYDPFVAFFYHPNAHHTPSARPSEGFTEAANRNLDGIFDPSLMEPGDVRLFKRTATRSDLGNGDSRHITMIVSWRDALGNHRGHLKFHFGEVSSQSRSFAHLWTITDGRVALPMHPGMGDLLLPNYQECPLPPGWPEDVIARAEGVT